MRVVRSSLGGIRRRDLLRSVGVGAGLAVLVGCSDESRTGGDGAAEVLFWLPGGSDIFFTTHQKIAEEYSADNDLSVTVQRHTGDQAFMEVLLARIAAGNPPGATVLWDTPVSLAVRGSLTPLDDLMAASDNSAEQNWPESLLASCKYGDQTYGLPYQAGSYAMWYNQDWFEELGIPSDPDSFPKTWDDLRSLSKEFTRWDGDTLAAAGFVPPLLDDAAEELPIWSALNGGQIFDAANQEYLIDSEPNVEMMEYFVSWLDDEYKGDIRAVQASGAWGAYEGEQGQQPAFQNQQIATMLDGTWVMGDLYEFEPTFERWNIAANPVGPGGSETVSGFWPNWLAIPAGVDHAEEAFGYLDHLSVDGALQLFEAVPDLPTNANAAEQIPPPAIVVEKRGEDFAAQATAFFRSQLDISIPMWDSPVQSFAVDQLRRAVEQIANKAASPRDALAEAQRSCQTELESVL